VAKLVKIEASDLSDAERLQELEEQGGVRPASVRPRADFFKGKKLVVAKRSALTALLQERSEGDR
jgi:hypothetical protein